MNWTRVCNTFSQFRSQQSLCGGYHEAEMTYTVELLLQSLAVQLIWSMATGICLPSVSSVMFSTNSNKVPVMLQISLPVPPLAVSSADSSSWRPLWVSCTTWNSRCCGCCWASDCHSNNRTSSSSSTSTLWRPLFPCGYNYKACCAKPG